MRSPDQIGISWEENQLLMQQLREKAALENRRQHNIFEIDDYVVNEHPDTIEAVFQVENLTPKLKKPKTLRCGRWGNYPVGCNSVRHATDAEIKAGKRLEVNQ